MLYTCTVNNIDVSSNVLWVRELVWWCCASEPVHWHEKKKQWVIFSFSPQYDCIWLISWHYALGWKGPLCAITNNQCFHIYTHLNFENIFIIISDHCYYENKLWKCVSYVVYFFLSQGICHIKIESEGSIWFVNLY